MITKNGVIVVDAIASAKLLEYNGTLQKARMYMKFYNPYTLKEIKK